MRQVVPECESFFHISCVPYGLLVPIPNESYDTLDFLLLVNDVVFEAMYLLLTDLSIASTISFCTSGGGRGILSSARNLRVTPRTPIPSAFRSTTSAICICNDTNKFGVKYFIIF